MCGDGLQEDDGGVGFFYLTPCPWGSNSFLVSLGRVSPDVRYSPLASVLCVTCVAEPPHKQNMTTLQLGCDCILLCNVTPSLLLKPGPS